MAFGEILKKLRGSKTQSEIASSIGITKSSWAMYERSERVPRDEIKIRIAKYFGKSVQEIFLAAQSTNSTLAKKELLQQREEVKECKQNLEKKWSVEHYSIVSIESAPKTQVNLK